MLQFVLDKMHLCMENDIKTKELQFFRQIVTGLSLTSESSCSCRNTESVSNLARWFSTTRGILYEVVTANLKRFLFQQLIIFVMI